MGLSLKDRLASKKPAAKPAAAPAKKVVAKVAEEVEEVEETSEDDEVDEVEEEEETVEEEEAAPAPKKTVKTAAKPAGKVAAKPVVKAAAKKPAAIEEEAEEAPVKGKPLFAGARQKREPRSYAPGDWLPYEEVISRLHASLQEDEEFGAISKSQMTRLFKHIEDFLATTIAEYDIRLCGIKTRRTQIEPRIYVPGSALDKVATPYHTLVEGHVKVNIPFTFDKVTRHGTVDDNGNFIEGRFDDEGNFEEGTWINKAANEFEPAVKKVAAKKTVGKKK